MVLNLSQNGNLTDKSLELISGTSSKFINNLTFFVVYLCAKKYEYGTNTEMTWHGHSNILPFKNLGTQQEHMYIKHRLFKIYTILKQEENSKSMSLCIYMLKILVLCISLSNYIFFRLL